MRTLSDLIVSTVPMFGRDHVQGASNAPLALVEYGDFECPYCGAAYPVVKAIQKELGGQLCFAFRNFPLTTLHEHAQHAAEAAEAANAQGRFWPMHDVLFENQDALDDQHLSVYAATMGLDQNLLIGEILAGTHTARVREDFRTGVRVGVNGTPTFFVNGVRYPGPARKSELLRALTAQQL
jgi:protein-disulfide isomerase